jgi:hypothetical protein
MNLLEQMYNDPMMKEYFKTLAIEEQDKALGIRFNYPCWNCKKIAFKLRWKLCMKGTVSWWCDKCY